MNSIKLFFANLGLRTRDFVRNLLGINEDMQAIAGDMNNLAGSMNKVGQDVFELFHSLPFSVAILSLSAQDAAKLVNPGVSQPNMLLPILTAIVMQARQGNSNLQVQGKLPDDVRSSLLKRGFKVEDVQGSNDNVGTFILWT
jgi:hypothetical protein